MIRWKESPLFDPLDPINDFLSGNNLLRVAQSMIAIVWIRKTTVAQYYLFFFCLNPFVWILLFYGFKQQTTKQHKALYSILWIQSMIRSFGSNNYSILWIQSMIALRAIIYCATVVLLRKTIAINDLPSANKGFAQGKSMAKTQRVALWFQSLYPLKKRPFYIFFVR